MSRILSSGEYKQVGVRHLCHSDGQANLIWLPIHFQARRASSPQLMVKENSCKMIAFALLGPC
jgi:hypothetical protein